MFSKFFKHQPVAANTEEKVHLNVQSDLESSENNMVLRTEDLVKKYRQRTVVNHVSIDVTQGEIVGLLGPNGAGKTTTFYMTTGLITPNQGHIYLNDLDITDYPVYKRAQIGIGYLAQEASVFRKLSVEDNIRCVLEMTHTTKEYQRDKLESLIAEFRLQKVRKNLVEISVTFSSATETPPCWIFLRPSPLESQSPAFTRTEMISSSPSGKSSAVTVTVGIFALLAPPAKSARLASLAFAASSSP